MQRDNRTIIGLSPAALALIGVEVVDIEIRNG
jgi:hypothetical protein